jgi:hypothetical protein
MERQVCEGLDHAYKLGTHSGLILRLLRVPKNLADMHLGPDSATILLFAGPVPTLPH